MNMRTLHDGRQVDSSSEEWRHEAEAITLLRMPVGERKKHLLAVEARRGIPARQALQNTLMALWINKQAEMLANLNERARMDRLQDLRRDNKDHIIRRIEARLVQVEDSRSGLFAANDNNKETERAA
jgi:hypothetical protein